MSKKVVKKKVLPAPNGTPVVASTDARVAQQMRVLEVVGASGTTEKDDKKYSPRTESFIKQLSEVLDFFQYSRSDIAALVKRCHYDEQQIQFAVANIIEDRANHEQTTFSVVRTKKQLKEEKKIKEEEEKKEQDRVERELEKQRKDAEKRAQKEFERSGWSGRGGGGGQMGGGWDGAYKDGGDVVAEDPLAGGAAVLPPDPAILFAGPKPAGNRASERGEGEWWDGVVGNNNYWDWDNKEDGAHARAKQSNWEDGKDWDWQQGHWDDGEWDGKNGSHQKGDESWWSGDWDRAGGGSEANTSPPARGKRGPKEQKPSAPKKDLTEIWDMPDVSASANEVALDNWALGDIRAYERRIAGVENAESASKAQAPLESAMRTVEEIEREQLGGSVGGGPRLPAPAAPPGKSRIEMLLGQAHEASDAGLSAAAAERPERGKGKGGKGGSKGERGAKGERGERVERPDRGDRAERRERADTGDSGGTRGGDRGERADRGDREDRGDKGDKGDKDRLDRLDRSDDPRRQPMEEIGENVTVKKHSSMGCAVVSLREPRVREAILRSGNEVMISGIKVQMKPHCDKDTKVEVPTDIFVAWGRQVEKTTPLSERELTKHFDVKHRDLMSGWHAEVEEKARQAEELARQQKLIEEQQRQQAEQREREEQRRRFEEDLTRRRQEEEQQRQAEAQRRVAEEQKRKEEQLRIHRETQAKWISDLQGNWAHSGTMGTAPTGGAPAAHDPRTAAAAIGVAGSHNSTAAAAAGAPANANAAAAQTQGDPASGASVSGLNAAAAAYPPQAASAQAQWGAAQQWMQAMAQQAYHSHQAHQGWQQQMAQRGMQQMQVAQAAQAAQAAHAAQAAQAGAMGGMAAPQDYDALRAHAAYYAYMTDQQRGQQTAANYSQPQSAYLNGNQQNATQFGYGAAAQYGRGERI